MDLDESTDALTQDARLLLEDLVKGASLSGSNSETARFARTSQAIGMLLGALVQETRALRHSQEKGNRIAAARLEIEQDRQQRETRLNNFG